MSLIAAGDLRKGTEFQAPDGTWHMTRSITRRGWFEHDDGTTTFLVFEVGTDEGAIEVGREAILTIRDAEATFRPAVLDAEGVINGVVQHVATTNRILRALADARILLVKEV